MLPCGTYNTTYNQDNAVVRTRLQWGLLIAALAFIYIWPSWGASSSTISFVAFMATSIIAVLGLYFVTGLCGQINLGQAAFMAVGAYTTALLTGKLGLSYWIALPSAGLAAALIGLIFGIPSLRLKGFYLAVATIAAQLIIMWAVSHPPLGRITGGFDGIPCPPPELGSFVLASERQLYYPVITIMILLIFFAKNISRTNIGRAWVAIRDNDLAAEVLGINVFRYKLIAFALSAAYAGIAGALYAPLAMSVNPDSFTFMESVYLLGMLIVGGASSAVGAVAGVVFLRSLIQFAAIYVPQIATIAPWIGTGIIGSAGTLIFGLVIMLFLIFEPRGLSHRWELFKASYRLHPFAY